MYLGHSRNDKCRLKAESVREIVFIHYEVSVDDPNFCHCESQLVLVMTEVEWMNDSIHHRGLNFIQINSYMLGFECDIYTCSG